MLQAPHDFPPPRSIAVDVDDTLMINGQLNIGLAEWIRSKRVDGYTVALWSMRGEEYARCVAERLGVAELFDAILSKPGIVIDDKGLEWLKRSRVVRDVVGAFKRYARINNQCESDSQI